MRNSLKRDLWLVAMICLGFLITSCTQTKGTEYNQGTRSQSAGSTSSTPGPNADTRISNMDMPAKPTATASEAMRADVSENQVVIENFSFAPATLTVKPGTKVTWVNRDDEPHTVNENDNRFKSGTMEQADEFSYTFSSPGTFSYFCALHPKMTGQIVVK